MLAAGDVARAENAAAGRRLRVEHWGDALAQGEVAGRTAAGESARWTGVPGFWTQIGAHTLKYAGWGDGFDEVRVDSDADGFTAWYRGGDRIAGVLTHGHDDDYASGPRADRRGGAMELSSIVVVPARDEERRIAACLRALADQTVGTAAFEVVLVLDGCRDATETIACGRPRSSACACAPSPDPASARARPGVWAWSSPPSGCSTSTARRPDRHHRRRLDRRRRTGSNANTPTCAMAPRRSPA